MSSRAEAERGDSRPVHSNQQGPHPGLLAHCERQRSRPWQRPFAEHAMAAFAAADAFVSRRGQPLVLDAGCGTGRSSLNLARLYPDCSVIGVDRSAARLGRGPAEMPDNLLLIRANLEDFWRLARQAGWQLQRHYLLYPNPYPRKQQLARRWHAHPVFPDLLALGGRLECRSNWQVYLQEMQRVMAATGQGATIDQLAPDSSPLTPFETKYAASGQTLWRLVSVAG